jgi:hypothetical protein
MIMVHKCFKTVLNNILESFGQEKTDLTPHQTLVLKFTTLIRSIKCNSSMLSDSIQFIKSLDYQTMMSWIEKCGSNVFLNDALNTLTLNF